MVRVAVLGAAGYAGIETVRLVLGHPSMDLVEAASAKEAGRPLADVYPALVGLTELTFAEPSQAAGAEGIDLAFLAVPHTASLDLVPPLLDRGVTVIDLSADFRLRDAQTYKDWYGTPHTSPHLLDRAVYGLPELGREALVGATLVACPGCYPTASALAAVPALEAGLVGAGSIVIDAKSGVSGAGRSPSPETHYCAVDESLAPYKVFGHRHTPEITQVLSDATDGTVSVAFAPHLAPMDRGLLADVYLPAANGATLDDLHAAYARRYADEPFVHVHEAGRLPSTAEVRGSNRAHLGVAVDEGAGMMMIACAIDNLVKGAAGQAVQCANIVLGEPETAGLDVPSPIV